VERYFTKPIQQEAYRLFDGLTAYVSAVFKTDSEYLHSLSTKRKYDSNNW